MADELGTIAATLEKEVFQRITLSAPAVFLVGAARSAAATLRDQVRDELAGSLRSPRFDVYYPEDLFEELLRGGERGADLLELENLLAENVHAVVILLESPGAIAEMGAFCNHQGLRDRLVVVVDAKHRRDRSFIMLGPVSFLQRKTKSEVIFHKLGQPNLPRLGAEIRTAIRKVSGGIKVDTSLLNPVAAQHHMRVAIQVLQPVSQATLQALIQRAADVGSNDANRIVTTSLSILRREGEVALGFQGYTMTDAGKQRMKRLLETEPAGAAMIRSLDRVRIEVLSFDLRKPKTWRV